MQSYNSSCELLQGRFKSGAVRINRGKVMLEVTVCDSKMNCSEFCVYITIPANYFIYMPLSNSPPHTDFCF
jgi:hypothetical protein